MNVVKKVATSQRLHNPLLVSNYNSAPDTKPARAAQTKAHTEPKSKKSRRSRSRPRKAGSAGSAKPEVYLSQPDLVHQRDGLGQWYQ